MRKMTSKDFLEAMKASTSVSAEHWETLSRDVAEEYAKAAWELALKAHPLGLWEACREDDIKAGDLVRWEWSESGVGTLQVVEGIAHVLSWEGGRLTWFDASGKHLTPRPNGDSEGALYRIPAAQVPEAKRPPEYLDLSVPVTLHDVAVNQGGEIVEFDYAFHHPAMDRQWVVGSINQDATLVAPTAVERGRTTDGRLVTLEVSGDVPRWKKGGEA